MQIGVMPVEQDNPMALLQTSNTAFTKLSTLLVYLVNEIDCQATQVHTALRLWLCSCLGLDICGVIHATTVWLLNSMNVLCKIDPACRLSRGTLTVSTCLTSLGIGA